MEQAYIDGYQNGMYRVHEFSSSNKSKYYLYNSAIKHVSAKGYDSLHLPQNSYGFAQIDGETYKIFPNGKEELLEDETVGFLGGDNKYSSLYISTVGNKNYLKNLNGKLLLELDESYTINYYSVGLMVKTNNNYYFIS